MTATTVYNYTGTLLQFTKDSTTALTTLNTNLTAGYLLQSVTELYAQADGQQVFLWSFQTGGVAL